MIFNSLFTQLVLAALAVALIFVYCKPTMESISETRETIEEYKAEQRRVNQVNDRLALLVNEVNSISPSDQRALLVYMPDKVDAASVSRDIFSISQIAGVDVTDIKVSDSDSASVDDDEPVPHGFRVVMNGPYENIKNFLGLLEQNNYPLEVHEMTAYSREDENGIGDNLVVELMVVTYSRI